MKIYEVLIDDHENNETSTENIAVLETNEETSLYDDENYSELFADTGFYDDDIFFYIRPNDIPEENNGEIQEGDTYDFITIIEINCEY